MRYLVCLLLVLSPLWVPVLCAAMVAALVVAWSQEEDRRPLPHH